MKTVNIEGVTHRFDWEPTRDYLAHFRKAHGSRLPADIAKQYAKDMAINYARWLAARDGVSTDGLDAELIWEYVPDSPSRERRVHAVQFGKEADRPAWSREPRKFDPCGPRVEIPHWDWLPGVVIEREPEGVV